ncbi:MAG: type 1 glutamine amidotransferase [Rhodospirillales bacterium]|nr:type 1 glutamine amidotransferase [Rhodospirillales bacterium]
MGISPRILVVDGYVKAARDELEAGGATAAGIQYVKMLQKINPDIRCDIIYPSDPGTAVPAGKALSDYDGVAWTGCSLTVFEDTPEVNTQLGFARACFEAGVPGFGSCWAAQIAVVAAGGICRANPHGREMGFARKVLLSDAGRSHPMYEGKARVFDAYISHVDEITHIPPGTVVLAGNAFTPIQSVSVLYGGTPFWGLQYHPEYDLYEMARLTWCRIDKLMALGFFKDRQAGEKHVALLEALHADPNRFDLSWRLGIDADILDEDVRRLEVRNWISKLVIPTMLARGRS